MPEAASRDNAMKLLARQFEIVLEVTGLRLSAAAPQGETNVGELQSNRRPRPWE